MDLIKALERRFSTKLFDPNRKISKEDLEKIETLLQLSPSSVNSQPWHFIIATTEEGRERIAKGASGFYQFNRDKVTKASVVILFSTKVDISRDFLTSINEKENKDGRYAEKKFKEDNFSAVNYFVDIHKYQYKDLFHWGEKQVYLNLGNLLLGVATLGIDAIAMEGFDMEILDKEFGLREKGFTSSFVVSLGYHHKDDFNSTLPKSRLSKKEIIERI